MLKFHFYFEIFLLFFIKIINCGFSQCFEYSCDECVTEEYGKCTKCRPGFKLLEGTCPCADPSCALCEIGLAALNICNLCKNGYYNYNNDCYCDIKNCELCTENTCLKCKTGYYYNNIKNECEEENEFNRINCKDENCKSCFTEEIGGCDICKEGYNSEKGICIPMPDINANNKCPDNYYLDNESHTCKKNCEGIDCPHKIYYYYLCPSNECLFCTNNVLQIFSNCDNSDICTKPGCLNCIDNENCIICQQGYYLLGGECRKCIDGCSYCSNNETCIYCLSGFKLNSQKQCIFNNELDFNVRKYKQIKNQLIKYNYPLEPVNYNDLNNRAIPECDPNCGKCFDNTGICKECDDLHILKDNKCIMHCSDPNCLECALFGFYEGEDEEKCIRCKNDYLISNYECKYNCTIPNCTFCKFENDQEICIHCESEFDLDESNNVCKEKVNYFSIAFFIIGLLIIVICIISFCLYKQKKRGYNRRQMISMRYLSNRGRDVVIFGRNNNNINNNHELESSQRTEFSKAQLKDEFEIQKRKMEKGNQLCQFCKKNPGKYKSDCGCIICKEHSTLKIMEGDGENYKVCFSCGKLVKKVTPIKNECHICLQKKANVVHFKCGCAIEVCKDCYIKCKMGSNKCPGCRALI